MKKKLWIITTVCIHLLCLCSCRGISEVKEPIWDYPETDIIESLKESLENQNILSGEYSIEKSWSDDQFYTITYNGSGTNNSLGYLSDKKTLSIMALDRDHNAFDIAVASIIMKCDMNGKYKSMAQAYEKTSELLSSVLEKEADSYGMRSITEVTDDIKYQLSYHEDSVNKIWLFTAGASNEMKSHIVNSAFDFTPSEFYEVFGNTLPDGYELNTELVHNALFNDMLQISILYSDSKSENRNTGVNVAFGYVEETDTISQIMLWSSIEAPTDVFETLLSWYLKAILPEMSTETYEAAVEKFSTDFKEDRDAFSAIIGDDYAIAIKRVSGFDGALVYHYVSIALK